MIYTLTIKKYDRVLGFNTLEELRAELMRDMLRKAVGVMTNEFIFCVIGLIIGLIVGFSLGRL